MSVVLVIVLVVAFLLVILYLFPEVYVDGDSMYPTYLHGEVLRGCRLFSKRFLKPDMVIIYESPVDDHRLVIKRIARVSKKGLWCVGDNSSVSFDSRYYGSISPKKVKCIIIQQRKKEERIED